MIDFPNKYIYIVACAVVSVASKLTVDFYFSKHLVHRLDGFEFKVSSILGIL